MEFFFYILPQLPFAIVFIILMLFIGNFFKKFKIDKNKPRTLESEMLQIKQQMSKDQYAIFKIVFVSIVVLGILVKVINILHF